MTPITRLKAALKPAPRQVLDAIASTGIEPRLIRRAVVGQQVNASTHLRLCAAIGIDPVTGNVAATKHVGDLHRTSLGSALRMRRIVDKLRREPAAKQIGVSYATLRRLEYGEPVFIEAVLAACRWLDRHPYEFCSPYISRETRSAA